MSKQDAYQWLADILAAPLSEAHIGYLGEYYCKEVIQESRKLLEKRNKKKNRAGPQCQPELKLIEGGAAS